jgi:murein DD-endopeptidase MepM/ murein hydrolase activator NlpD
MLLTLGMLAPAYALTELDGARAERERLEDEVLDAAGDLEGLEDRIHAVREDIEQLDARDEDLRQQLDAVGESLAARARAAFMRGDGGALEAILAGEGPSEAAERAALLESLALRDRGTMEEAAALRTGLEQNRQLREGRLAELAELEADMEQRLELLNEALAEAEDRERFLELKARRQREVQTAFASGIYSCPVGDPVFFRDTWGAPRSGGRSHKGVDMMAPHGTPIYAMHAGSITRLNNSGLGGISIYMFGDDGNEYYYTHLQGYADGIHTGKRVDAGDLIAYNGSTGNADASAPHLHLQVHPGGGAPVNPYPWAAAACGR